MSSYLLHQRLDGIPVGIFTETEHYYLPLEQGHESYGVSVVESKGKETEWEDWIEQLANKTPGYRAQWDVYEHDDAPLEDVLIDARTDTSYPE